MEQDVGLNCDGVLKNQLVFQRAASTADRMNIVIAQIQNNQNECASDIWSPLAVDGVTTASGGTLMTTSCIDKRRPSVMF